MRRARRVPRSGGCLTAAAAGIVVGVGTGHGIYDDLPGAARSDRAVATPPSAPAVATPVNADAEDTILAEVEVALAGRGVEELQPLDALRRPSR